jgi:hypothetical protein
LRLFATVDTVLPFIEQAYAKKRKHWSGFVESMRGTTSGAIFMELKRLGFHVEAHPKRRLVLRRPEPEDVEIAPGFSEDLHSMTVRRK